MAMDMSRRQIVTLVESLDPERTHWIPYQTFVDKAVSLPAAANDDGGGDGSNSRRSKGDRDRRFAGLDAARLTPPGERQPG